MSMADGEAAVKNLTDKATYERLEKDVTAVKNDIAALTDQITDALNSFAGTAGKQARRGYKQARANAEQAVDDMSERGGAMMDAAQSAASHGLEGGEAAGVAPFPRRGWISGSTIAAAAELGGIWK